MTSYIIVPSSWATHPDITARRLGILIQIARCVNWTTGKAVVRQNTLAAACSLSRGTIQAELAAMAELRDDDGNPIIAASARHDRDGYRQANEYELPAFQAAHSRCPPPAQHCQYVPISPQPAAGNDQDTGSKTAVPPADWQPGPDDIVWLAQARPDLIQRQATITTAWLSWHRSRRIAVASPSASWRAWATRERATQQAPATAATIVTNDQRQSELARKARFIAADTPVARDFAKRQPRQDIAAMVSAGYLSPEIAAQHMKPLLRQIP